MQKVNFLCRMFTIGIFENQTSLNWVQIIKRTVIHFDFSPNFFFKKLKSWWAIEFLFLKNRRIVSIYLNWKWIEKRNYLFLILYIFRLSLKTIYFILCVCDCVKTWKTCFFILFLAALIFFSFSNSRFHSLKISLREKRHLYAWEVVVSTASIFCEIDISFITMYFIYSVLSFSSIEWNITNV